jgi:hypothetical protein
LHPENSKNVFPKNAIPEVYDIPITVVNKILY